MPYTTDECWAAVESVLPVIEMCGRRSTAAMCDAQPPLGKLADALMAGGVVMGKRHARDSVDRAALATYSTSLLVNGVEVASGATSQCPQGGPVESLTWYVFESQRGAPIKEYMHAHALHMRTHARTCAHAHAHTGVPTICWREDLFSSRATS